MFDTTRFATTTFTNLPIMSIEQVGCGATVVLAEVEGGTPDLQEKGKLGAMTRVSFLFSSYRFVFSLDLRSATRCHN